MSCLIALSSSCSFPKLPPLFPSSSGLNALTKHSRQLLLRTFLLSSIDHFTVVCLVAWPLNESEAGVDLVLIETTSIYMQIPTNQHENRIINMRKAGRFLSEQGHPQPHFHSRARQLSKKL